jgi:hypothetical protein
LRDDWIATVRQPANGNSVAFVTFRSVWSSSVASTGFDLTLSRQFSLETQTRAIDACDDPAELRRIAKTLLSAWHMQADMTRHYGAQAMGLPGRTP